ncbi:DUF7315 family membrane protein [Halorhabdus amylolytica]|uniref:DUF7315 family membrane protein n=1 Tax=Halorhabdus amylolytica TaxID=2559573 RepID=UPI0020C035B9|nr:hypothetical protein [Halorhabdus amylolytica]
MSHATHTGPTESTVTDGHEKTDKSTATADGTASDRRDVVVPLRVYKAVSVFSTLFAILAIVAGFVALDGATNRATAELSEVDPLIALAGLGTIVFGAVVYAFSTRFRTEGMGPDGGETDG